MSKSLFTLAFVLLYSSLSFGQTSEEDLQGRDGRRIISTAVPFLNISPDTRHAGMGDVGVATSPDANAMYWNQAKLAFLEGQKGEQRDMGFSLSYTPWLRQLINDMSLSQLAGYKRLSDEEVIGVSLTYFDLGSMVFRDQNNNEIGEENPREFAFGTAYSRKLSDNLSVSLGLKYIYSNLSNGFVLESGGETRPGQSAAADLGVYYKKEYSGLAKKLGIYNANLALGANISNVGAKISYTNIDDGNFIPTNLRLGTALTAEIDPYNKFTIAFDINKLMVPTPPAYYPDSLDDNNDPVIRSGMDPDRSMINGMFTSFVDAPGGVREELQEIMMSVGIEYWYANALAVRAGYFYESAMKGNRKYFTVGIGVEYNMFGFDFAYLIPQMINHPLQDTVRFGLSYNINKQPGQEESIQE